MTNLLSGLTPEEANQALTDELGKRTGYVYKCLAPVAIVCLWPDECQEHFEPFTESHDTLQRLIEHLDYKEQCRYVNYLDNNVKHGTRNWRMAFPTLEQKVSAALVAIGAAKEE